jgi:glycosyltransferase involved in cell wall biosynthesis
VVQRDQEPIITRVGFTLLGDGIGTGAYNYLVNLLRAIGSYVVDRLQPVLFVGPDVTDAELAPFRANERVEIVQHAAFDRRGKTRRLAEAVLAGVDRSAAQCFRAHGIDIVFESASFFGKRLHVPAIAWLPDFQHRHLRHLFGTGAYWKREMGFRAQVAAGRSIMLSSNDARQDCERFYPGSAGHTSVVHFSVPVDRRVLEEDPAEVARQYDLPEAYFYLPNQFWKHKNHPVVIEALDLLRQRGVDCVVAATGKAGDPRHPEYYNELQEMVKSRGLGRQFRFLGLVPRAHVFGLLRGCTALINPSLFEGWSTPVEEARSLGVPMLLSNLAVHVEQMGDMAKFFSPHSAPELATLIEQYPRMDAAERRRVELASIDAAQSRVADFGKEFLATVERAMASAGRR